MKLAQRGRPGAAALSVIGPQGLETIRRPSPPSELTAEQADEWRAIVNRLEADHFPRETWPMLVQLCREITRGRRLAQLIETMEKTSAFDPIAYQKLVRTEQDVSKTICSLSTKMRISQQATVRQDLARKPPVVQDRPWD